MSGQGAPQMNRDPNVGNVTAAPNAGPDANAIAARNAAVMALVKNAKIVSDVDAIGFNKNELEVVKRVKLTNVGTDHALIKVELFPKAANATSIWHVVEANGSANLKFDRRELSPNVNDFTVYVWYVAIDVPKLEAGEAKEAWEKIVFPRNMEDGLPAKVVKIFIAN